MGAKIADTGGGALAIEGGTPLAGTIHRVMPDRIELGTIACAAALTDGEIVLEHGEAALLGAAGPLLAEAGGHSKRSRPDLSPVARRPGWSASISRPSLSPASRPISRRRSWRS